MAKSRLERFVNAQETDYDTALSEIRAGRKRTHWMWYIFPQVEGLGFRETSRYYAVKGIAEAEDYFRHPLLGQRLIQISNELLHLDTSDATAIFGSPDDLKLKSCMTLFALLPQTDPVFASVLSKFFGGRMDELTVRLIAMGRSG
jgi:uncharacterized protein (DUF1810 family)